MIPIQKDYIIADEHKPGMNGRGNASRKLHQIFSTTSGAYTLVSTNPSVFAVRPGEAIRQVQDLVKKHVFATALVAHTIQFCYWTWKVCLWTIIEKCGHGVFMDGVMFDHPSRRQNLFYTHKAGCWCFRPWKSSWMAIGIETKQLIYIQIQKIHPKFTHPPHLNFMFVCFCQQKSFTNKNPSIFRCTQHFLRPTLPTLQRNLPPFQEA